MRARPPLSVAWTLLDRWQGHLRVRRRFPTGRVDSDLRGSTNLAANGVSLRSSLDVVPIDGAYRELTVVLSGRRQFGVSGDRPRRQRS
jgi:hypothetical protein